MSDAEVLLNLIRGRRSVRQFTDEPVDSNVLSRLVEAASWAPSAGNQQDWRFDVVTSPATKQAMADAVRRRWAEVISANRDCGFIQEVEQYAAGFAEFAKAPVVIVVSARAIDSVQEHLLGKAALATAGSFASAAMAAQNLMLAAHALGLGSCCMTGPLAAHDELRSLLNLGRKHQIVCLLALGHPAEAPPGPPRKPVEKIARWLE